MLFILCLLFISIIINLLVLYIDTLPFLIPLFKKKFIKYDPNRKMDFKDLEKKIVKRALKMSKSSNVTNPWSERRGFTETVYSFMRYGRHTEFKKYSYPRGFLLFGLSQYLKVNNSLDELSLLKDNFDKYVNPDGTFRFNLNKVDQVPFGLAAINLYQVFKEEKYSVFFKQIYMFLLDQMEENGLILYRTELRNQLNDLIGMIIPFLVEYYKISSDIKALAIAKHQIEFYVKNGIDKETCIPAHGIDLISNVKTGSINWGRGIGWYLFGLTYLYKETNEFENEISRIFESLLKLKTEENLYSQFPGSSIEFDASTSTMFYYCFCLIKKMNLSKEEIMTLFGKYIDNNGSILQTSGDTNGWNSYSKKFGKSELSQGIFLLLLTTSPN